VPEGLDIFSKTIDPGSFQTCLRTWTKEDVIGINFKDHLKFDQDQNLRGYKTRIDLVKLAGYATDGT